MTDYDMSEDDSTAEEKDLAVFLCQEAGDNPALGRWRLYLERARMLIAFRKWEAEQE